MPTPPPGVSARDFAAAAASSSKESSASDWVFTSDDDVDLYRDALLAVLGRARGDDRVGGRRAGERRAGAGDRPHREPVQDSAVPDLDRQAISATAARRPCYPGSVVLDLKRMNRVLEVNEQQAYCVVEPGVSYFDLYRHLAGTQAQALDRLARTRAGAASSATRSIAAAATRASTIRDHFDAHCGMEVVLPNGELVRTGMGAHAERARRGSCTSTGFGPWVDGIFSQSNFGVVTKMGFWLMPEPEAALRVTVTVPKRATSCRSSMRCTA